MWLISRAITEGSEWQCMSTAPTRRRVMRSSTDGSVVTGCRFAAIVPPRSLPGLDSGLPGPQCPIAGPIEVIAEGSDFMDFAQLKRFIAVVEGGSLGKAAETLSLSQPGLSKSIHQ